MKLNGLRKQLRQKEAAERNARWAALTPQQQLAHLDTYGLIAARQRAKIQARIAKEAK